MQSFKCIRSFLITNIYKLIIKYKDDYRVVDENETNIRILNCLQNSNDQKMRQKLKNLTYAGTLSNIND